MTHNQWQHTPQPGRCQGSRRVVLWQWLPVLNSGCHRCHCEWYLFPVASGGHVEGRCSMQSLSCSLWVCPLFWHAALDREKWKGPQSRGTDQIREWHTLLCILLWITLDRLDRELITSPTQQVDSTIPFCKRRNRHAWRLFPQGYLSNK